MPRPRKLNVVSARIAAPASSVAATISGAREFGKRWRSITRQREAPRQRAASTNSFSRSAALSSREQEFVLAARCRGASRWRVMLRHLLPNSLAPLIVAATLDAGAAIRAETTLSFLGLGIQPPTPSWGNLLTNAATNIFLAPLQVFLPGLFIFFALMSFNLLGDALRDALDPRLAERGK